MTDSHDSAIVARVRCEEAWAVVARIGGENNVIVSNNGIPAVFSRKREAQQFAQNYFGSSVVPARYSITLLEDKGSKE